MDKEKKLLEKQLADTVDKRRKLEDIHIELIELNRQKASILNSYSDAWQGNLADNTIRKLEDDMDTEWRETRKHVNALEAQLIEDRRQLSIQLEQLKENEANGTN
ncbi:hypothetical protein [Listeria newyorkensis]|uniref:Uncharacterized protein n=1 Tax=Listeria newyorkensis TaxID=1497681 RepID=A0A841YZ88_9LIST|nr:hypothetical protein [Listeria newyorkensis]MBC1458844.1 hypothetical protein [Listeria newyorkensis]